MTGYGSRLISARSFSSLLNDSFGLKPVIPAHEQVSDVVVRWILPVQPAGVHAHFGWVLVLLALVIVGFELALVVFLPELARGSDALDPDTS